MRSELILYLARQKMAKKFLKLFMKPYVVGHSYDSMSPSIFKPVDVYQHARQAHWLVGRLVTGVLGTRHR